MTFSDIINKVYFLTSTNVDSFPTAKITVEANNALDRIAGLIFTADNRWQYDDTNYTDLPIATTAIVIGQQDYGIITAFLDIDRVEIKDSSGNWGKLKPFDQADIYNQSLTDFLKTTGLPVCYDVIANSVFLYPPPNYSQADSLKIYFKRGPSYFVGDGSDNTKVPGLNSLFQELIPLWIAYNFAIANGKENAPLLMKEIERKEESLTEHYALRNKDDPPRLKARPKSYR